MRIQYPGGSPSPTGGLRHGLWPFLFPLGSPSCPSVPTYSLARFSGKHQYLNVNAVVRTSVFNGGGVTVPSAGFPSLSPPRTLLLDLRHGLVTHFGPKMWAVIFKNNCVILCDSSPTAENQKPCVEIATASNGWHSWSLWRFHESTWWFSLDKKHTKGKKTQHFVILGCLLWQYNLFWVEFCSRTNICWNLNPQNMTSECDLIWEKSSCRCN